jgi:membrane fusion protein (multidrug efflux system)
MRRRWKLLLPVGAGVLSIAIVGIWLYLATFERTDDAQVDSHIGAISSRVIGVITEVHAEDNQRVTKGQVLIELDPRDYQVAVERAQAVLAQAVAQLEAGHPRPTITALTQEMQVSTAADETAAAGAQLAAAERDLDSARGRVIQAEANAQKAAADRARWRYLLAERATPVQLFDEKKAAADVADAEVRVARALARASERLVARERRRLSQAESRAEQMASTAPKEVKASQAALGALEASVKEARAALVRAQLDLEYTKIVAPFDGIVGKRSAQPGMHVAPGEELMALVDVGELWITANFKETQLKRIRVGQKAHVHVDALGRRFNGKVESLGGASGARFSVLPPENATGNFVKVVQRLPVRIRLDPGQDGLDRLRPGMSVEPRVTVK